VRVGRHPADRQVRPDPSSFCRLAR
jgi:hypothetical protein